MKEQDILCSVKISNNLDGNTSIPQNRIPLL